MADFRRVPDISEDDIAFEADSSEVEPTRNVDRQREPEWGAGDQRHHQQV